MPVQVSDKEDLTMSGAMSVNFGNLLACGTHSDFDIQSGGHVFKVHKAILCSTSSFFKAAIEGNTKENEDKTMTMPDDPPAVIARLLIFIYTGTYFVQSLPTWKSEKIAPFKSINDIYRSAATDWTVASKLAIAMYQIADKTFVSPLAWASRRYFLTALRPDRDTESEDAKFWKTDDMTEVSTIIKLAYNCTRADDWMLHDPIVHRLLHGVQDYGCVKWKTYQTLLEDVPRLAFEIATSELSGRRRSMRCLKCREKTQQRLWRCKCGLMEACGEAECNRSRRIRSICDKCVAFGTVL